MNENDELLKSLETREGEPEKKLRTEEEETKFLIFTVGSKRYALYADEVREIIGGNPVFYLPFVPAYIRGLINRHGDPHTVFDIHALLEQEKVEADSYLILKLDDDKVAILISEIQEIVKIPVSKVSTLTSKESEIRFFSGSVPIDDREVFILHVGNLLAKLETDLEKV